MSNDPRAIIDDSPMGAFQVVAIGITILLNALDGFDVLAISFAAPGIAAEWGIDRAQLGIVLSMELIGMAVGSLLIGGVSVWTGMQAYSAERAGVIAILRSMGATRGRIFVHFFAQVAALAAVGVGIFHVGRYFSWW